VKVEGQVLEYLQKTNAEAEFHVVRPGSPSEQVVRSKQDVTPSLPSSTQMYQTWGKPQQPNRPILSENTL
jgi:hypothetical protein